MEIYAGETLSGTMVLEDDNGQIINDFSEYDIIMLIRNKFDDYQALRCVLRFQVCRQAGLTKLEYLNLK